MHPTKLEFKSLKEKKKKKTLKPLKTLFQTAFHFEL